MVLKDILTDIQSRLQKEVSALRYTDKNWGQLNYTPAAVTFPCCLIDSGDISYTQQGRGDLLADAEIVLTIANQRLSSSSALSPDKEDSFSTLEIIGAVRQLLHGFAGADYSGLMFASLRRVYAASAGEVYRLTFKTAYIDRKEKYTIPARPEMEVETK